MALVAIQANEGFPSPLLITPGKTKAPVLSGFNPFFLIATGIQKQGNCSKENEDVAWRFHHVKGQGFGLEK
jgi:hypothetical protein